jgi:hypothetical protein
MKMMTTTPPATPPAIAPMGTPPFEVPGKFTNEVSVGLDPLPGDVLVGVGPKVYPIVKPPPTVPVSPA